MELTQNGNRITGSANGVNHGDHWGPMGRKGGTVTGTMAGDGTILLQYNWNDGTYSEDVLRLSPDGKSLSGTWTWYTNSSKTTSKGTGTYMLLRN